MKKIIFDKETQEKIIEKHNQHIGSRKIVKLLNLNCSDSVIQRFLKNKKVESLKNYRKYFFKENYFECIDTEEKAYWLGFLYADGCVFKTTIRLNLSLKDIDVLKKFAESIQCTKEIEVGTQNSFGTEVEYARLSIYSIKMVTDLIDKGCIPKKSLILQFPNNNQVPKELLPHFIRGYFDGDGGFSYNKTGKQYTMNFCGTLDFLSGIKEFFNVNNPIAHDKRHLDKNIYSLHIGGNLNVLSKGNMMYENAHIFLLRKMEIYKKLKSLYNEELIKERNKFSSLLR